MIKIELIEDTKAVVVGLGQEEKTINLKKGTVFEDVEEAHYADAPSEWQYLDEDMVSTFIPQDKCVVLS